MQNENAERASNVSVERNRQMFNNPELSDVRFIVEGQTLCGHKLILAINSPEFKSMFYGEQRVQDEEIMIEDQTFAGFKNALR